METLKQCHQYLKRVENLKTDLESLSTQDQLELPTRAGEFNLYCLKDIRVFALPKVRKFIETQEWLGTVPGRVSHTFVAEWRGHLAGAVLITSPHQPAKLLSVEGAEDLERLIARGACVSWSPKNLGSRLIGYALQWMVANTQYRVFTAYCDPDAKELGTIYQACNALYLGNTFGADRRFRNLKTEKWFSSRRFSTFHTTLKLAGEWGIPWDPSWNTRTSIHWEKIPVNVRASLKAALKLNQDECMAARIPLKHKYLWVLGQNRRETLKLRQSLAVPVYPYPKTRGI